MPERPFIVGVGELVYDHVFVSRHDGLRYFGSRGGGSVFNLLANVASWGGRAAAIGVAGKDWFGEAAKMELHQLGVDASRVTLLPRRCTRVIFETLHMERERFLKSDGRHDFSATCLLCLSAADQKSLARIRKEEITLAEECLDASFFCFDRLTNERVGLARIARQKGITSVLDLGRIGYLRYFPATQIVAALNSFDILLCPVRVAVSLARRAGYNSVEDLARVGPQFAMFVSNGPAGMTVYDTREGFETEPTEMGPAVCDEVIDDAGAGDAFLASILLDLGRWQTAGGPPRDLKTNVLVEIARRAVSRLGPVLSVQGARGHLRIDRECIQTRVPLQWAGLPLEQIRISLDRVEPCPFCGACGPKAPARPRPKPIRAGAKTNIGLLLRRVFFVVERKDAIKQCQEILTKVGTAYTVGTGGSYSVAVFLSALLSQHGRLFAQAIRPFDYIRAARVSDYLLVITYSGASEDCAEAIGRALELGVKTIVLITGAVAPELARLLRRNQDVVISFGRPGKSGGSQRERGFVSIAGTVAPCALWTAAAMGSLEMTRFATSLEVNGGLDLEEAARRIAKPLRERKNVAVLGGGLAWPAMVDMESKFTEGGLGNLQIHEMKDFSHGRFVSLLGFEHGETPVVCLGVGAWHAYERVVLRMLERRRAFAAISTKHSGILGALELLIRVQFFAQLCGEALEKDISRPSAIPHHGLKLYRWKGGLR